MAEPESQEHIERKVVVETKSATTTGNSATAWVIIGVVALALIILIIVKMT